MGSSRNRGIPVTPEKLVFIEQKMREKGINSRENLAELAGMSEDWVRKKLFAGKNVERTSIEAISKVLEIEPTEIIEIDKWHPQSKAERAEASRNIDWQKICCEVLELQQKQFLTSYPLGTADRRVRDVYVPLGLIERQVKPRVEKDLDPTNWSVQKQEETIKPVSHQNFFESVLKGQSPKSKGKRIAIIGEPGAGKTTLLQEICSKIEGVPIWIDLASLKKGDVLEDYLLQKWLKSYLSLIQEHVPTAVPDLLEPTTDLKKSFTNLFTQSKVWLLLDGADEMASELRDPLNWVAQGLQNSAWVANARVVLTSRLNIWSDNGDRLVEFDTYRNLDFEPEGVQKFIDKWFAEEPNSSRELKKELERSSDRIRSLIRNPLRLTLLCLTWKGVGDRLPETKAGLYQRLVNAHHKWKSDKQEFLMEPDQREQLHKQLGELSKNALDSEESRFRLRESYITNFLGKPDQERSLFWWATKLGWLNQIGLPIADENDADEPVYAFLHPTFQEYFAALTINNWDYFLPLHKETDQSEDDSLEDYEWYRIFEPQWIEVILLWIGRPELDLDVKQAFVDTLVFFQDECVGCYEHQAFFIAVRILSEFEECDLANEIIEQLLEYAFDYNIDSEQIDSEQTEVPDCIAEFAKSAIPTTNQKLLFSTIERIYKLIPEKVQLEIADLLIDIHKINDLSIEILEHLINYSEIDDNRLRASTILIDYDIVSLSSVKFLENLVNDSHDDSIRSEASTNLLRYDPQNSIAITTLIELASEKYNASAIEGLGYAYGNTSVIEALERIIEELEPIIKAASEEDDDDDDNPEHSGAYWNAQDSLYQIKNFRKSSDSHNVPTANHTFDFPDDEYYNSRILEDLREFDQEISDMLESSNGEIVNDKYSAEYLLNEYMENFTSNNEDVFLTEARTRTEIEISKIEQIVLCNIEKLLGGKNLIIRKILDIIYSTEDDQVFYDTLAKLEEIAKNNEVALNGVIKLAVDGTRSHRLNMVIDALANIGGQNNLIVIDLLLRTIITPQKKEIEWIGGCAVESLKEILLDIDLMYEVVAWLGENISDDLLKINSDMALNCFSVLWYCSQYLSYPDFCDAWHGSHSANEFEIPIE